MTPCMYPMGHRFKHTHDGELPCGCACQLLRGHKGKHQCERQLPHDAARYPSVTNPSDEP